MKINKIWFFIFLISIMISGCALTNNTVQIRKARVIYDVPKNVDPDKVKDALYQAISIRAKNIKDAENFMPNPLPKTPKKPVMSNIYGYGELSLNSPKLEAAKVDISNAWYSIIGEEDFSTPFNENFVYYKGAIYPYKNGYRVYIYEFYKAGTAGLIGHLTNKIQEKITHYKEPLLFIAQISHKFKELVPQAKLIEANPKKITQIKLNELTKGY